MGHRYGVSGREGNLTKCTADVEAFFECLCVDQSGEGFYPLRPCNGGHLVLHRVDAYVDVLLPTNDQIAARKQKAVYFAVLFPARHFAQCGAVPLCSRYCTVVYVLFIY